MRTRLLHVAVFPLRRHSQHRILIPSSTRATRLRLSFSIELTFATPLHRRFRPCLLTLWCCSVQHAVQWAGTLPAPFTDTPRCEVCDAHHPQIADKESWSK